MGIRKRVSRACDECRLHKARCDGINPCETCERYDRVCSYNLLPSECKGSAARIRILENRLIKANECITQLKKQTPDTGVRNPQSSLPLKELEVHQLCISPGSGTLANQDTGTRFISSLLRPLSYDPEIKALADSQSPGSLLKDNNFETSPLRTGFCQLPAYDIAIERIYTAFNSTFGLCSIIPEQTFRIATQRLYEVYPISYTQEDFEFIPLFHAIIALGIIHRSHNHLHEGARQESLPYFEAAAFTFKDDQCLTVPKLQIRLCLVLYQLTVSRLDLARPMLQVICASSIVHSLHQSVTLSGLQDLNASDSLATNIIWTIFYVDMHISSLTQVPAFLGSPGPEMTTVYAINSAAYNVAHYRRSNREFLLSVSLAMAIELLKLIQRVFPARPSSEYQTHSVSSSNPSTSVEVGGWNKARSELQTWDYMLQNIFPENEGNLQISLAGSELKIHHCLAEILLYHSFLECLAECTAMGDYYEIDDINKGRACVTAATNAISHISGRLMQIPTSKLTWSSAYTVFISTLTLLVAAAFAHPNERHAIHGTIQIAIHILQSTTYGSSYCKKSYLDFIQALSERVMMPCNFATSYQSKSPAEPPAPSGSATTANSGSWCNSSPQDAPNMMRIQSWPTTSDGEILEEWGFDAE